MKSGFTYIEILVVISLIAILAAGVWVYVGFYKGMKLEAAAEKLSYDIRYAQNQALCTTLWHGINFEVNPVNKYYVYQTDSLADTLIQDPADFASTLVVDLYHKYGVTINSVNLEGGENKVEFDGLGRPYTDHINYGGWVVSAEGTIVLGLQGLTKTITITPVTGKVTIQ